VRVSRIATLLAVLVLAICSVVAQTAPKSRYADTRKAASPRVPALAGMDSDSHFQRLLANGQVRVFRLSIAANESTQLNAHPYDYVVVSLGSNEIEAAGEINTFPLQMNDSEAQILTGGWSHKLVNKASQQANLLVIEVMHGISPDQSICGLSGRSCGQVRFGNTADGRYSQTILFETAKVRLMRAELGPGGVLPTHADPSDHLVLALNDARLTDGFTEATDQTVGYTIWTPGGLNTVKNAGKQDARMLILEVK
jgi:hypothetical protein